MTRNGAVLRFSGPFADRDGLRDLTPPIFKDTRVLRPAYAALGSQVLQQFLFQRSTGLNEQASVKPEICLGDQSRISLLATMSRNFRLMERRQRLGRKTDCQAS